MNILYIIRGLPGSGKSTLAKILAPENNYSADDYFQNIKWDKSLLGSAHTYCKGCTELAMMSGVQTIAVANTFTRKWEYEPYRELADEHGYKVIELVVKSDFKSIHAVPEVTLKAMKERFEYE